MCRSTPANGIRYLVDCIPSKVPAGSHKQSPQSGVSTDENSSADIGARLRDADVQ